MISYHPLYSPSPKQNESLTSTAFKRNEWTLAEFSKSEEEQFRTTQENDHDITTDTHYNQWVLLNRRDEMHCSSECTAIQSKEPSSIHDLLQITEPEFPSNIEDSSFNKPVY